MAGFSRRRKSGRSASVISSPRVEHYNPFNDVLQLADITGPPIVLKSGQQGCRQHQIGAALFFLGLHEKVLHQLGDVLRAIPQRRQLQRNYRQAGNTDLHETSHPQSSRGGSGVLPRRTGHPPSRAPSPRPFPIRPAGSGAAASPEDRPASRRFRRGTGFPDRPIRLCPTLCAMAPVNDPFTWPNSSDSSRSRGMAPQLMVTNGLSRRAAVEVNCLAPAALCRCRFRHGSGSSNCSVRPAQPCREPREVRRNGR